MAIEIRVHIPTPIDIIDLLKNIFKRLATGIISTLRRAHTRITVDLTTKKWRGLIVLALCGVAFYFWGFTNAVLWLLFLLFLVYAWENRIIFFIALVSLATSPVLLSSENNVLAENVAAYAYIFLVMAVFLLMVESFKEGRAMKKKVRRQKKYEK